MKIEKLNENRVRFTFNITDLQKKNIDIHSFMANSIESQSLFLDMLDEAEREIGFITDNYKLSIEALALSNGSFIVTVTRIGKEALKSTRVQPRRKTTFSCCNKLIYHFSNFDDFCNFRNFLADSYPYLSATDFLYKYNDSYFLVVDNYEIRLSNIISEFANNIEYSDLTLHKLQEYGTLITKNALHKVSQ